MIYRKGEIQDGIVKQLRLLADQIEKCGIIDDTASISITKRMEQIINEEGFYMTFEPTLEREIYIKFTYAKPPVFTAEDCPINA